MKRVKLTKLNLEVGDKKIELSPDEAKELYGVLQELFGHNTVFLPSTPVVIREYPYPIWYYEPQYTTGGDTWKSGNVTITNNAPKGLLTR